jgi:hypothetical protein
MSDKVEGAEGTTEGAEQLQAMLAAAALLGTYKSAKRQETAMKVKHYLGLGITVFTNIFVYAVIATATVWVLGLIAHGMKFLFAAFGNG